MKSQVLLAVWCNISGEAAGEIWHWSLSGVKGLTCDQALLFLLVSPVPRGPGGKEGPDRRLRQYGIRWQKVINELFRCFVFIFSSDAITGTYLPRTWNDNYCSCHPIVDYGIIVNLWYLLGTPYRCARDDTSVCQRKFVLDFILLVSVRRHGRV